MYILKTKAVQEKDEHSKSKTKTYNYVIHGKTEIL